MDYNKVKYGISDEAAPIGTWLVYIAYLVLLVFTLLAIGISHIDLLEKTAGPSISGLFLFIGFIIFALFIFLIAPVLQIIGIYSLWIKKYPEEENKVKRKKRWRRVIACAAYLLNILAFVWLYFTAGLS